MFGLSNKCKLVFFFIKAVSCVNSLKIVSPSIGFWERSLEKKQDVKLVFCWDEHRIRWSMRRHLNPSLFVITERCCVLVQRLCQSSHCAEVCVCVCVCEINKSGICSGRWVLQRKFKKGMFPCGFEN